MDRLVRTCKKLACSYKLTLRIRPGWFCCTCFSQNKNKSFMSEIERSYNAKFCLDDCCDVQIDKYLHYGLRNRQMMPDAYFSKLTDYSNETKQLNHVSVSFLFFSWEILGRGGLNLACSKRYDCWDWFFVKQTGQRCPGFVLKLYYSLSAAVFSIIQRNNINVC